MKNSYICTNCNYVGEPITKTKGSFLVEIALWLLFLFPGIIYSLWRMTTKDWVCPACKSPAMIPTTTPRGQELFEKVENKRIKDFVEDKNYQDAPIKKEGANFIGLFLISFIIFLIIIFIISTISNR